VPAAKYRKKPVVIEAIQYTGDNFEELDLFTHHQFDELEDQTDDPEVVAEVFDTLHSTWVGVKLNNWIIEGIQGEFYPCDADVFENTYEKVE
jgi:hypothetical protein